MEALSRFSLAQDIFLPANPRSQPMKFTLTCFDALVTKTVPVK